MSEVECITLDGHTRVFNKDRLILRPAAYALIIQDGKILLLKMQQTGKYHLPGGGIHLGEPIEATLKRELLEETGVEIEVVRFAHFEEIFFYYDPSDRAYHGLHFYYFCKPKTLTLLPDDQVEDGSAEKPRWLDVRDLNAEDFQIRGDIILELCRDASSAVPHDSHSHLSHAKGD